MKQLTTKLTPALQLKPCQCLECQAMKKQGFLMFNFVGMQFDTLQDFQYAKMKVICKALGIPKFMLDFYYQR